MNGNICACGYTGHPWPLEIANAAKQHLASRAQVRSPFPPARLKYQASYRRCAKMIQNVPLGSHQVTKFGFRYHHYPKDLKGKSAPEPHLSLSWNWLLWLLGGVLHCLSRHGAVHGILGLALLMSACRTKGRASCPSAHCKEVKLQGMIPKILFCLDQRTIQQSQQWEPN